MKLTKTQLLNVIDVMSQVAKQDIIVKSDKSELRISFNNISHFSKVNGETYSSTSETVENLGRYCLNEFYNKEEEVEIKSLTVDNEEFSCEGITHIQFISDLANFIIKTKPNWRVMFLLTKGSTKVELNTFDAKHIYRKYVSPDNNLVIIFKELTEVMVDRFKDYKLQSFNIYKDKLTESKFRDYMHDTAKSSGKQIRFTSPEKGA